MISTQAQKTAIEWLPFSPETFLRAQKEQKPVFLHIGFPSCHWCHVMERESFHDAEIIAVLSEAFLCVDVDREKRPDVDAIYMAACQATTGQGGWPLTALLTPQQQPFFIATYLPRDELLSILLEAEQLWATRRDHLNQTGAQLAGEVRKRFRPRVQTVPLETRLMTQAARAYASAFDAQWGGTGGAPKFPMPQTLTFLLRHGALTKDEQALFMAEHTLSRMCEGGIFDHVGGGFMRYSTDRRWAVPHYEKMLIDNALLAQCYFEAWQITERSLFHDVAERVLSYVINEMTDPEGGFYASQDADAEGREGAYYELTQREIIGALGQEEGEAFSNYYGLSQSALPNRIGHSGGISTRRMAMLCERVQAYRKARMPLYRDEKLLTAWNGAMITAFARGYLATGNAEYCKAAQRALSCVQRRLQKPDGGLYTAWHDGEASGDGLLEDYAYLAEAALTLYRATLGQGFLDFAVSLARLMLERFEDKERGGFFMTPTSGEKLIARPLETADGAQPSGNAVALSVLVTLSMLDAGEGWERAASRHAGALAGAASAAPVHHMASLTALMPLVHPSTLLDARAGEPDLTRILEATSGQYMPHTYIKAGAPGTAGNSFRVCKGKTCFPAFRDVEAALKSL